MVIAGGHQVVEQSCEIAGYERTELFDDLVVLQPRRLSSSCFERGSSLRRIGLRLRHRTVDEGVIRLYRRSLFLSSGQYEQRRFADSFGAVNVGNVRARKIWIAFMRRTDA